MTCNDVIKYAHCEQNSISENGLSVFIVRRRTGHF